MTEMNSIGNALLLLRRRQGLTQSAAGKRLGAPDFRNISHWETGRKTPSLRSLLNYLEVLGVDLRALQDVIDGIDGTAVDGLSEVRGQVDRMARVFEQVERELKILRMKVARHELVITGSGEEVRKLRLPPSEWDSQEAR